MDSNKTIIEVNGVKLEVDLRTARRVEEMRVGTRVKVLKKGYGETFTVHHGVIIGFEPFKNLPTIIVAMMTVDYSEAKLEFVYFNAKTEGVELVVAADDDVAALDKADICQKIDREIEKRSAEIKDLQAKRAYFLAKFACYWAEVEQAVKDATS